MRPTRLGLKAILFYALLICAFFAAPYLNLFFLLLTFLSVLAVLNLWWSMRNITGVDCRFSDLEPMPAHASQLAHVTMQCQRRVRHDLSIEITTDSGREVLARHVELGPGVAQRVEVMLPSLRRGEYGVETARVTSIFPFGMVRNTRRMQTPGPLLVYPAPADLSVYRDRNGIGDPGGPGSQHATEMGPAGLREYREGDEMRRVHWKASARRRELVVKELEADSTPGLEVLLDLRVAEEPLEEALSLIAALALECRDNKELFTLYSQDHSGTYGKGHLPLRQLLTYLARVQRLPADAPSPPTVSPIVLRLPLRTSRPMTQSSQQLEGASR